MPPRTRLTCQLLESLRTLLVLARDVVVIEERHENSKEGRAVGDRRVCGDDRDDRGVIDGSMAGSVGGRQSTRRAAPASVKIVVINVIGHLLGGVDSRYV